MLFRSHPLQSNLPRKRVRPCHQFPNVNRPPTNLSASLLQGFPLLPGTTYSNPLFPDAPPPVLSCRSRDGWCWPGFQAPPSLSPANGASLHACLGVLGPQKSEGVPAERPGPAKSEHGLAAGPSAAAVEAAAVAAATVGS